MMGAMTEVVLVEFRSGLTSGGGEEVSEDSSSPLTSMSLSCAGLVSADYGSP